MALDLCWRAAVLRWWLIEKPLPLKYCLRKNKQAPLILTAAVKNLRPELNKYSDNCDIELATDLPELESVTHLQPREVAQLRNESDR